MGPCPADAAQVRTATRIASVDLDGDGTADAVKLTDGGGECPHLLFAKLGQGYAAVALGQDEPPVTGAFAAKVPGRAGTLLVTRANHPRGGFQLRVYAAADSSLAELTVADEPLVPFVATDVEEHPLSVDCGEPGGDPTLVLTEAVPHEPHGIAFAWDVRQTTYTVTGTRLREEETEEVADNVLPRRLATAYPELRRHLMFRSCRA